MSARPRQVFGLRPRPPFLPQNNRLIVPPPPTSPPTTPTSATPTTPLATGFFTPPAALGAAPTPAAVGPPLTLTAVSVAAATPAAAAPQTAGAEPGEAPDEAPLGEESAGAAPAAGVVEAIDPTERASMVDGVTAAVMPQASAIQELPSLDTGAATSQSTASVSPGSSGGVAAGSIAGVAFFVSLIFILWKWRRGTLPASLNRIANKIRPSSPDHDSMEKGLKRSPSSASSSSSDSSSIRSAATSATSYSTRAITSVKAFLKPSSTSELPVHAQDTGSISGPVAYSGPEADKLAVPLPLYLAKLQAAGLWSGEGNESMADAVANAGGHLNPKPVVPEPLVHPLRSHAVQSDSSSTGGSMAAWPMPKKSEVPETKSQALETS